MKTILICSITMFLAVTNTVAQDAMKKFTTDVCSCLQKLKPETISNTSVLDEGIQKCLETFISKHQEELKKSKALDFDTATDSDFENMWKQIFQQCQETTSAVFSRKEQLEDAAVAKSFQGMITYVQSLDVSGPFKKMGITKEMLMEEMKKKEGTWFDTVRVYYRGGNYASFANNESQTTKIYDASENMFYNFHASGSDVCSVQEAVDLDLNGAPDKPTVTVLDSVATIMGLTCKIVRINWKLSQYEYYYNDTQAKVSPELFSRHSSEGLAEFVRMTGSLPLQIVRSTMGVMVVHTATHVTSSAVDSQVFTVPELVEDESLNIMKLPGITMMRVKR